MLRILIILSLIAGGVAMAAPKDQGFDPMKQRSTPEGFVPEGAEPTEGEMAEWMWRRFAGDKPMPDHLRKKYGLPAQSRPLPAGR